MVRRNRGRQLVADCLVALVALALALPAAAQDGIGQGKVTDAKGQPVEGATVTIELAGSGRKFETKTEQERTSSSRSA